MPLYEYVCRDCGRRFEAYVRAWTEAAACPSCAGSRVDKQLSRFAFATAAGGSHGSAGGGCGCGAGGCGCAH
jgi:putative FmdB family regulatory protein